MTKHRLTPVIERFRAKIEVDPESGCWLWTAATNDYGYGMIGLGRRGEGVTRAHRWSYEFHVGVIPEGMFVCHRCDVPRCVNPDHLFLGSNQENVRDAVKKDRHSRGQRNGHAKLTRDDIRAIRADPRTNTEVAREYGVQQNTISRIRSGKRWRHVA